MFDELTTAMFGQNARRVPAWMYVQDQGDGFVSFVGGSKTDDPRTSHPARYGSARTHQFVVGELIIRPHLVVATDALRGEGLSGLATSGHQLTHMLTNGEVLLDPIGMAAKLLADER